MIGEDYGDSCEDCGEFNCDDFPCTEQPDGTWLCERCRDAKPANAPTARAASTGCVGAGDCAPLEQPHAVVEESLHWADGTEMPMRYVMVLGASGWLRAGYTADPRCTADEALRAEES